MPLIVIFNECLENFNLIWLACSRALNPCNLCYKHSQENDTNDLTLFDVVRWSAGRMALAHTQASSFISNNMWSFLWFNPCGVYPSVAQFSSFITDLSKLRLYVNMCVAEQHWIQMGGFKRYEYLVEVLIKKTELDSDIHMRKYFGSMSQAKGWEACYYCITVNYRYLQAITNPLHR